MAKGKRISLDKARSIADDLAKNISANRLAFAGSIRRRLPFVRDIDLIASGKHPAYKMLEDAGVNLYERGDKRASGMYKGMSVNLWKTNPKAWGATLLFATGPAGYGIAYRKLAKSLGMKLNNEGLWEGDKLIASKSERDIFEALGKKYKKPEMRGM